MSKHRKGFAYPNDPILIKKADKIPLREIKSPKTKKLLDKMLAYAFPEQGDKSKPILVGLAAPQVKISKRIILVDVKAEGHGIVGDLRVYINPEIVWKSKEKEEWYEGCYSTDRVCGIVSRPKTIKVKAYSRDCKLLAEKHTGYVARIFQHEIDHLNGIEFVTHIKDDDKLHWVEEEEFPVYRNSEGWRNWSKKCPREKWEKIKGINKGVVNGSLVNKVEKWVTEIYSNAEHLIRTGHWVKRLQPKADDALIIAAISHDIERAFQKGRKPPSSEWNGAKWDDPIYNKWHSSSSASYVSKFLRKKGASSELIRKVSDLIKQHETGGNQQSDILRDADSLSFLEINVPLFISRIPDQLTKDEVKEKFDYMYKRIGSDRAKRIAFPYYKKALATLSQVKVSN